jgi:hypothetical protein
VHSLLTRISSTESIETLRREKMMWKPGDRVAFRGIYDNQLMFNRQ